MLSIFKFFTWPRFWLAGPLCLVVSVFLMASSCLILPHGNANIDHLVIPIVMFPLIWTAVFFYALLEQKLLRATVVLLALLLVTGLLTGFAITGVITA